MDVVALEALNVCSFESILLRLYKQGLVWIGGANNDTEAAVSNGSGKTNLFKVVSWALYGETIGDEDGDKIIRIGTKCASAKVLLRGEDAIWRIERERRKGAPKLRLYRDDVAQDGSRIDLQQKIDELLGLDFQAFRNTALYGQRDLKRFIEPGVSDAQRKEVLQRILRTSLYKICLEWIKEQVVELKRQIAELSMAIADSKARLDENRIDELEAESYAWELARKRRYEYTKNEAKRIANEIKAWRMAAPNLSEIESRLEMYRDIAKAIPSIDSVLDELGDERLRIQSEMNEALLRAKASEMDAQRLDESLTLLEGESMCPTCHGDLNSGNARDYIAELRSKFELHTDDWHSFANDAHTLRLQDKDVSGAWSALRDARRHLQNIGDMTESALAELDEARAYEARIENAVAMARKSLMDAKAIAAEANPHLPRLELARDRIVELNAVVEEKQSELDSINQMRAHYEFWLRGFGPMGLPSFTLDRWMPYLTERANHYLEILSDGDIKLTFSTQKALKTKGELRDEIDIKWTIENVEGYPPSGGQFKKMSIATDFALRDMACSREGGSVDFLFLDECLDGMDSEGRQRVLQLLHSLRSVCGTIFVISHDSDIAEVFERAILVTKKDGISRLEVIK